MACFSSLVSLEKTLTQILDHGRYSISRHEKNLIISLDKYAISFQDFLEDFPEKAKKLEARIRDVAAEAEDIIEWIMIEQIRPSFRCTKWIADLRRRNKFEFQLKKVRDEMDSIVEEMAETTKNSSNDERVDNHSLKPSSSSSSSSSTTQIADSGKTKMVGLNEDLIEIMDRLCGNSPQLQILPIFGMGGIGKTTLARNAYDDPLIVEYFHIRAWVTVSQDFSERRILLGLLDATQKLDPEWRNESMAAESNESLAEIPELSNCEMEEKVYRALIGRRFLIVMDDMWSTKALDYVKMFVPNGTNGSRIMLTTRLANVAAYANSAIPFHEMRLMDADQSWHLLRQKISLQQNHIPLELESTGKEIARSCGGLPLAVVVVAGLLSIVSRTRTSWEEIARNVKSSLTTTVGDGQMEKILSLSYNHLPLHLRPCFLYMGGFPEDHEIKVTSLLRLWLAEGFVKTVAYKSFEDIAQECLEGLVERSLVLVVQRKSNGKIKSCSLHDLVREICMKISKEEKFLMHITGSGRLKGYTKSKGQRRISVSNSHLNSFANTFSSKTRTIMYFQDKLSSFGSSLRLLRVLDVLRVRYSSRLLPDQFFELFHLRYLAFCYDEQIPRAIANLQNLQTLIVKASLYRPLPHEIWNMPQLRHLVISGCQLLIPNFVAPSFLPLQNLQTLGKVKNLTCLVSILNMLPNLKKLRLTFFRGSGDLLLHNLVHLSRLEKLQLELETDWPNSENRNHLVAPSSLKKLTLIGWGHYKPHLRISQSFPNLQVLKLINFSFKRGVWTTNEGDFPQLKFLLLDGSNLEQWNILSSHFPRLEVLVIRACWRLSKLPADIAEIPTLELIELKLCSESMADSATEMQEERLSYGDDAFRVCCIDCEDINELKEVEFTQILESVTKSIERTRKRRLSYRKRKEVIRGIRGSPYDISYSFRPF